MLVSNLLTVWLFQQILDQGIVTLASAVMRLLARRMIGIDRRVPRVIVPSAQPIVFPRSFNIRTSLGVSWMALFEGAFNAQVKKSHFFKEAAKFLNSLTWIFLMSSFVICVNLLYRLNIPVRLRFIIFSFMLCFVFVSAFLVPSQYFGFSSISR